jgi:hypothetical protein
MLQVILYQGASPYTDAQKLFLEHHTSAISRPRHVGHARAIWTANAKGFNHKVDIVF